MSREICILVINSDKREVTNINTTEDELLKVMQTAVGGYIERAQTLANGDDVFVDEEGLLKNYRSGFVLDNGQPLFGNGVIVRHTPSGNARSAKSSGADIINRIKFFAVEDL
jgi:hypothetical protein